MCGVREEETDFIFFGWKNKNNNSRQPAAASPSCAFITSEWTSGLTQKSINIINIWATSASIYAKNDPANRRHNAKFAFKVYFSVSYRFSCTTNRTIDILQRPQRDLVRVKKKWHWKFSNSNQLRHNETIKKNTRRIGNNEERVSEGIEIGLTNAAHTTP